MASGAALRRAVAQLHGLLRNGRNRKKPHRESRFYPEDALGDHWTLPEQPVLIIRCLIMPLTVAVVSAYAGQGFAQGAFPAPLPGQTVQPNDPAFPPVNGAAPTASIGAAPGSFPANGAAPVTGSQFERGPAAPSQAGPSDECMRGFVPLREDAEKRGKLIKAASEPHAPPD